MKKIILITGANRGIGKAIADQLSAMGHEVIRGIRTPEPETSDLLLDVSDLNSIRHAYQNFCKQFPRLDVLINNAGIIGSTKGLTETTEEEFRNVMETNYFGAAHMTTVFTPMLMKSSDARVINISSQMGAWNSLDGYYAAYRLSKVSLNALTVMLAAELNGKISVNSMCPGWVKTDMGGKNAPRSVEQGADTAVWLSTESTIPTGKFFSDRREVEF